MFVVAQGVAQGLQVDALTPKINAFQTFIITLDSATNLMEFLARV
jgi:hypothetical protein